MSSCHGSSEPAPTATLGAPTVLLVGNPNVGKSTLFNSLTGSAQRVMNAPGTTVELQTTTLRVPRSPGLDADLVAYTGRSEASSTVRLVDLPGTYSLVARSPDEQVTADAVAGRGTDPADLVVVLVEAGALARSLYLLGQVLETTQDVVVALTMTDVAADRGIEVDPARLGAALGLPVVAVDPRSRRSSEALAGEIGRCLAAEEPRCCTPPVRTAHVPALAEAGETELEHADRLFTWVDEVVRTAQVAPSALRPTRSDRIDRVLLHPVVGVPVFLAVMWALFQLATSVAAPLMDGVDGLVNGTLADWVRSVMIGPEWVSGFLVDGLLAGVGTVLSFAPLMGLMFLAIAVLEDSGYLARAAFVADKAMRAIGLDGRAMLPLVVGFGCNLPALAATKTLPNARQRLLTGLLVPYTSCAARLTVYILLASVFFPQHAGTVIFLMYVTSIALVIVGGLVLRSTLFRDVVRQPFVLALPAYQRPRVGALLRSAWSRVRDFVTKAGTIIVATLAVVWVLQAIPATGEHQIADVPVADSVYGRVADAVAPVFAPAGFDDWRASAALVTGFVAKEVVVGSFAQSYAVDEPDDPADAGTLG
ncbi:MAG: ferrous iron transporter B, partial [Cellulomonadaceae bacterium]